MSLSGEEGDAERLREQEQARASQILRTPRESLSRILTPRDLISADLDTVTPGHTTPTG